MKIEGYHSVREQQINRRDAKLALAALMLLVALMLAGWLHTWFVTRPMCEAVIARQDAEMEQLDSLLAEASEMMEEIEK